MLTLSNKAFAFRFGIYFIVTIAVILQFFLAIKYGFNLPLNPDDAVICLDQFPSKGSVKEFLTYITSTKNGHPQIFQRVFTYTSYLTTGEVNFKYIILLSLSCLVGFVICLFKITNNFLFCALSCLILSFHPNLNLWTSVIAANYFSYVLFFIVLFLFESPTKKKYLIPLILSFAILSFGNGIGILPCLFLYLLIKRCGGSLIRKEIIVGLGSIVIAAIVYFTFIESKASVLEFVGNFWNNPLPAFEFILEMNGIIFKYLIPGRMGNDFLPEVMTLVISIWVIYLTIYNYRNQRFRVFFILFSFCVLTSILGSIGRAYSEVGDGLAPRYEFNGLFFLFSLMGMVFYSGSRKSVVYSLGILLVLLSFLRSVGNIPGLDSRTKYYKELSNYLFNDYSIKNYETEKVNERFVRMAKIMKPILEESMQKKIYNPPAFFLENRISHHTLSDSSSQLIKSLNSFSLDLGDSINYILNTQFDIKDFGHKDDLSQIYWHYNEPVDNSSFTILLEYDIKYTKGVMNYYLKNELKFKGREYEMKRMPEVNKSNLTNISRDGNLIQSIVGQTYIISIYSDSMNPDKIQKLVEIAEYFRQSIGSIDEILENEVE